VKNKIIIKQKQDLQILSRQIEIRSPTDFNGDNSSDDILLNDDEAPLNSSIQK